MAPMSWISNAWPSGVQRKMRGLSTSSIRRKLLRNGATSFTSVPSDSSDAEDWTRDMDVNGNKATRQQGNEATGQLAWQNGK